MALPYTPASNGLSHGGGGRARGLARRDAGRLLHASTARSRRSAPGSRRPRSRTCRSPGGALPVALSDTVRLCATAAWSTLPSRSGPASTATPQCVTAAAALAWAAALGLTPSSAPSARDRRHGIAARPRSARAAEAANAAARSAAGAVLAVRVSDADPATATAASRTTRGRARARAGAVAVAGRGRRMRWEEAVRGLAALAHGPRPGRRSRLLRGRLRRRRGRSSPASREWRSVALARRRARHLEHGCAATRRSPKVVGAALGAGTRSSIRRRCTAPRRPSAPPSKIDAVGRPSLRRSGRRRVTKRETQLPASTRLVRPRRAPAGAQPRRLGAAPAVARRGARRASDRPARCHALRVVGVRRARPGDAHRTLPTPADPAEPERAHGRT